tara:strand:+ start:522 stop:749 length:228 start_codon:yes stop_codon:yes gene_type:complete
MMNIQPIEGYKHLVRDNDTGAVLNINTEIPQGLKLAKLKKRKEQEQLETNTSDINSIKSELTEIKTMLRTLIDGR